MENTCSFGPEKTTKQVDSTQEKNRILTNASSSPIFDNPQYTLALEQRIMFDGVAIVEIAAPNEADNNLGYSEKQTNAQNSAEIEDRARELINDQSRLNSLLNYPNGNDSHPFTVDFKDAIKTVDGKNSSKYTSYLDVFGNSDSDGILSLGQGFDSQNLLENLGDKDFDNQDDFIEQNKFANFSSIAEGFAELAKIVISSLYTDYEGDNANQLIIVDGSILEAQLMLQAMIFGATSDNSIMEMNETEFETWIGTLGIRIAYLDSSDDGIKQLDLLLQNYEASLDLLHIISHSNDGELIFGKSVLTTDDLSSNSGVVSNWSNAFTERGDILIYGCKIVEVSTISNDIFIDEFQFAPDHEHPDFRGHETLANGFSDLANSIASSLDSEISSNIPRQLVVIDGSVADANLLLQAMLYGATEEANLLEMDDLEFDKWFEENGIKVAYLDNERNGLEQLNGCLNNYNKNLDVLHIISHGVDGALILGNTVFNSGQFSTNHEMISNWSKAFSTGADILLYGCNVAQTTFGQSFVSQLANFTGTDVSASTNLTGGSILNGDWDLEYSVGLVESKSLSYEFLASSYEYVLAVNDPGLTSFFTLTDSTVTEDDGNALTLTLTPGAAFTSGGDFAGRVGYDFAFETDAVSETRFDISSFVNGGGGTLATGGQITGAESVLITLKGGSEVDDHATRADDDTILGSLVININANDASASTYSGYLYETINPTAPDSKFSFGAVTVGSAASTSSIISGTADPARRDVTISIDSATDELVVDLNGIAATPTRVSYMAEYFDASTKSRDLVETVSGSNGVQNFAINAGGSSSINVDIDNGGNLADEIVVLFEMGRTVTEASGEPSASGRIVVTDTGGGNYIANGIITSSDGFTGQDNGVTYTFENYSLASGNFIIASGATLAGTDTTGFTGNNATTGLVGNEIDFRLSISGSNLVIEQSSGVTAAMDSLYVVQTFENNVNPSAAIDLGTTVANATNAPDDATNDFQVNNVVGGTADIYIPIATGAKTGTLTFGSQAPTGNATGENHWVASVNIDLENSTTSGYSVGRRSSTTDLVSWSNVALGTSTSGGSSGTVELVTYSGTKTVATIASGVTTNHSVGQNFNDPQVGGLTFSVYSDSSGNEFIRVQAYRAVTGSGEYILEGAAVQWQGQETIRMEDVPDGMVLSGVTFTEETQMDGTRDIIMTADDILAGTPVLTYQVGGDNYNGSFVQNFQLTGDASLTSTATFTTTAAVDNVTLTDIAYNDFTSSGNTVAEILNTTDQDPQTKLPTPGYVNNIAITGLNNDPTTGGKWQYSLDGATWFDVGTVSTTQALLLNNDDKLRYVPGVTTPSNDETADISFLAWDGTGSTDAGATAMSAGNKIDTTQAITDGEQSVLSATSDTANINITAPPTTPGGVASTLSLWLKADEGVVGTTSVTQWTDQSGNEDATQVTASNQPSLNTNSKNFNPGVTFDGDDVLTTLTSTIAAGNNPYTVITVATTTLDNNNQAVLGIGTESNRGAIIHEYDMQSNRLELSWPFVGFTVVDPSLDPSLPFIVSQTYDAVSGKDGYLNGDVKNTTVDTSFSLNDSQPTFIGRRDGNTNYFNGDIQEVIIYSSDVSLSGTSIEQVHAYLALKYGITLDQSSGQDYLASDGSTQMWDKDTVDAATYNNDIFGVGRDDGSELGQLKSKSQNTDGIITLLAESESIDDSNTAANYNFTDIADLEFLTIGNNDGAATWTATGAPAGFQLLDRQWSVQETGETGTMQLDFDMADTDFDVTTALNGGDYYFIFDSDNDGDLSDETATAMTDQGGDVWRVTGVDFADGMEFTLATLDPILNYSGSGYTEVAGNDGSLDNSTPIVITLSGGTFQDIDGDDILDIGTEVTIGNVPAGLTAVVALSAGDTVATLTFTGNATDHQDINDVSDLTFVFADAAFTGGDASIVINSGDGGAYSSGVGIDFSDNSSPGGVSSNLTLWLKADAGVTGGASVSQWNDQSGNLNHATQGSGINQPNAVSRKVNFNPVIEFDGANGFMNLPDNIFAFGDDDIAIYSVFITDTNTGFNRIISFGDLNPPNPGGGLAQQIGDNSAFGMQKIGLQTELSPFNQGFLQPYQLSTPHIVTTFTQNLASNDLEVGLDGSSLISGSSGANSRELSSTTNMLGQRPNNTERWEGIIAESIAYSNPQTNAADRQRIVSYLALKYGITLDQTTAQDYLASDGTTEMWDKDLADASTYNNDLFGIGRDDSAELGQILSKSVNTDGLISLLAEGESIDNSNTAANYNFTDIADLEFLTIGNNDGGATWTATGAPAGFQLLDRQWSVQEAGETGTMQLDFDVADADFDINATIDGGDYYFIYDSNNDGDLSDETATAMTDQGGDVWRITGVDFADGMEFTLATLDPILNYSGSGYTEVAGNDGSLDNSTPIVITLSGGTFQDIDGDDILDIGTEVTIGNVPAGLTPVVALSAGDTVATLTFSGSATDHQDINDVSDLTFVFADAAFTGGDAAVVSNSGDGGAYSSGVGIDFQDNIAPGGVNDSLALWLKADAGVVGGAPDVSTWQDQSGNGNDAIGQAAANPDLVTNNINYNPAIDFDFEMFNLDGLDLGNDFDFFIIINPDDTSPKGFFETAGAGQINQFRNDTAGRIEIHAFDPTISLSIDAKPNLLNFDVNVNPNRSLDYFRNATTTTSSATGSSVDINWTNPNIGAINANYSNSFDNYKGTIAELVIYTNDISSQERTQISSYLALKYGITLDQSIGTDYLASDGVTEIWDKDATDASTFNNDIFGIGRDDSQELGQLKSKSSNTDSVITLLAEGESIDDSNTAANYNFTDIADLEFLTIGNNDGGATWTATGAPSGYQLLDRQWSVQEAGETGTMQLDFNVADADFDINATIDGGDYYFIYDSDNDGDLSDETATAMTDQGGDVWRVAAVDFADGMEFTIASLSPELNYSGSVYTEVGANDGSVDNSTPIVITLISDTFQDIDGDDILDIGTEVTIGNVPAGLTAVVALSAGDTVATLTFTGNATDHQDINDVSDLTFVFADAAFTGGDAAIVSNSGDGGAYSSIVGIDFNNNAEWSIVGDASVLEGSNANYTLSLANSDVLANLEQASIDLNVTDVTTDSLDYASLLTAIDNAIIAYTGNGSYSRSGNTVTFTSDGNTAGSLAISLTLVDDTLLEGDESYSIDLSNETGTQPTFLSTSNDSVSTTIEDEELDRLENGDIVTRLSTSDASGTEGVDDATFTVELYDMIAGGNVTNSTGSTITVSSTILGSSSATNTSDYTLPALDIAAGSTNGTVTVSVIDDSVVEVAETLDVQINDTTGILGTTLQADTGNDSASITINDNEAAIAWALTGTASLLEGGNASYTLSLSNAIVGNGIGESVDINLTDVTTLPADYDAFLTAIDTAIASYNALPNQGSYARSGNTITFTGDGNAAGDLIITLGTIDDALLEGDESYSVALSNVVSGTGAILGASNSVTTTLEDVELDRLENGDIVTRLSTSDASGTEGVDDATFTVELYDMIAGGNVTNSTGSTITVSSTILGSSSATNTSDYTLPALDIAAGSTNGTVTVSVIDDSVVEVAETLDVQINDTTGILGTTLQADTGNDSASITINDNEAAIAWALTGTASLLEGGNASYTLSLGNAIVGNGIGESVDINLTDVTTLPADYDAFLTAIDTAIASYNALPNQGSYGRSGNTITFTGDGNAAGDLIITLGTIDDALLEGDESYSVALSNVVSGTGAILGASNSVTTTLEDVELDRLENGDIVTRLSTSDASGTEGVDDATFTVELYDMIAGGNVTNSTGSTITVSSTILGSSSATNTSDYTLPALDIAAGSTNGTVTVSVIDDSVVEVAETLDVQINDTTGILGTTLQADTGNDSASITINDNEAALEWALTGTASLLEGGNASYTLSLSNAIVGNGIGESVDINLTDVTTSSGDYNSFLTAIDTAIASYNALPNQGSYGRSGNTITFTGDGNAAGDLIITLGTIDDALLEGDESYSVALSNVVSGTGAILGASNSVTTTLEDVELDRLENGDIVTRLSTSDASGTEGVDDATFTVELYDMIAGGNVTNSTGSTITVSSTILGSSSATNTSDYTLPALDIAAGSTNGTVTVSVIDDSVVEVAETLDVQINDTTGILGTTLQADTGNDSASITINDNEAAIAWALTGTASLLEGGNASYTLSLGNAIVGNGIGESVDINLTDVTTSSGDYNSFLTAIDTAIASYNALPNQGSYARSGNTITFTGDGNAAGDLIITLGTIDDALLEGDESYSVALSNVVSGTGAILGASNSVTTTLEDVELDRLENGDIVTRLSTSDASGTEGVDDATFTVELYDMIAGGNVTNSTGSTITVSSTILGSSSATNTSDYTLPALDIAAGSTNGTVTVSVIDDSVVEVAETLDVQINDTTGILGTTLQADTGNDSASITINDNEAAIAWALTGTASLLEGGNASYTLSLGNAIVGNGIGESVDINLTDVTTSSGDYNSFLTAIDTAIASYNALPNQGSYARSGNTITFTGDGNAAGDLIITLGTIDDALLEGDESYSVALSNVVSGTGAILGASNSVTTTLEDVELDRLENGDIVTRLSTSDASGTEGVDDATFTVELYDMIAGGNVTNSTGSTITVSSTILGSSSATNTSDYTLPALDIAAGSTNGTVTVSVIDDSVVEVAETLDVQINDTTGILGTTLQADTGNDSASITINDNEAAIAWALTGTASLLEGGNASYTLSLGNAIVGNGIGESVDINLTDVTTSSGDYNSFLTAIDTAIASYNALPNQGSYARSGNTITFTGDGNAAGDLIITLGTIDDALLEGDESYSVALSNVVSGTGAILGASNSVTTTLEDVELDRLENGDIVTRLSTSDASGTEGVDDATFTVELYDMIAGGNVTNSTGSTITVSSTILGSSSATNTSDYTLPALDIAAGSTNGTVTVSVIDDSVVEVAETLDVQINDTTGILGTTLQADTGNDSASITINDNEAAIAWALTGTASLLEGGNASYTLSLSNAIVGNGIGESVDINLTDVTTSSGDYNSFLTAIDTAIASYNALPNQGSYARSGNTITFTGDGNAAGDLIITLGTIDDALLEGDESYSVALSNVVSGTGAILGASNSVTTTLEDVELDRLENGDIVTRLSTSDASGTEGVDDATFTVELYDMIAGGNVTNSTGSTITVSSTILGSSSATNTSDYTLPALDIAAGSTNGTVTVSVIDDSVVEVAETLDVQINDTTGILGTTLQADTGNDSASITINDNEAAIAWALTGTASLLEGGNASYTLSLGNAIVGNGIGESVDINLTDVTTSSGDYNSFLTAIDTAIASYNALPNQGSYARSGNTITFTGDGNAAGDLIITLGTIDDALLEGDESYSVALSNVVSGTGAILGASNSVTTTLEDVELDRLENGDIVTRLSTSDASGTEGVDDATFTVELYDMIAGGNVTNSTGSTITVSSTILGSSSATNTSDYTLPALDIAAGSTNGTVTVSVIDDSVVEVAETLDVQINDTTGILGTTLQADTGNDSASITINDNEAAIAWALTGTASLLEGGNASYTLSLGNAIVGNGIGESVDINLTDVTTSSGDYNSFLTAIDTAIASYSGNGVYARSGNTITFTGDGNAAGDLIITLGTIDDALLEGDESYSVALSNVVSGTGAILGASNSVTTTLEDVELDRLENGDIVTRLSTSDASGTEGVDDATFTVELYDMIAGGNVTNSTGSTITVSSTILGSSSATNTSDYTLPALDIAAGSTNGTVTVSVIDDSVVEVAETLDVQINDTTGILGTTLQADTGNDSASITINDNEAAIAWALTGTASLLEGGNASYTLSLGNAIVGNGIGESVDINLTDVTTLPADYDAFLTAIDTAIASYSGNGVYARSGNTITFTGDGNAAGDLIITLGTIDDALLEGDESYSVALSNVVSGTGAILGASNSVTTTLEDVELDRLENGDIVTRLSTSDASGTEGVDDATFTVELYDMIAGGNVTNSTGSTITVSSTILGSSSATNTSDYTLPALDIAAGSTNGTVTVSVIDDSVVEVAETLDVQINDTTGILGTTLQADTGNDSASITINDNEAAIAWALTGTASLLEGGNASYTLSLGNAIVGNGIGESVDINLTDITTLPADYDAFLSAIDTAIASYSGNGVYARSGNTITFTGDGNAAGDLIITLGTIDDALLEGDESYSVALSNVVSGTGAILGASNSVTTTLEDVELDRLENGDIVTRLSTSDASGTEGVDDATFTVELYDMIAGGNVTNSTGSTITVSSTILGSSSATNTSDYTLPALDIAAGSTNGTVTVSVIDDSVVEVAETLDVQINDTTGILGTTLQADTGNDSASITINDNEAAIAWALTGTASLLEGGNASYTLSLSNAIVGNGIGESVDINLTDVTTSSGDYNSFLTAIDTAIASYSGNGVYARSGNTITFTGDGNAAGDLIITLGTIDDALLEGDESYSVALSNVVSGTGAILGASNSVTTTLEDVELDRLENGDIVTRLSTSDASGTEGVDDATFTVELYDMIAGGNVTNSTGSTITVSSTILGSSSATNTSDYTLPALDIAAGSTNGTVTVSVIDDSVVEVAETLDVQINDTTGILGTTLQADTGNDSASITINDNEAALTWSLTGDSSVTEGGVANYTVSLGGVSIGAGVIESIDLTLLDGSTNSSDYGDFIVAVDEGISNYNGIPLQGIYMRAGNSLQYTGDGNLTGDLIVSLGTVDDVVYEGDEVLNVELSNIVSSTGAVLSSDFIVTTTIIDNESPSAPINIYQTPGNGHAFENTRDTNPTTDYFLISNRHEGSKYEELVRTKDSYRVIAYDQQRGGVNGYNGLYQSMGRPIEGNYISDAANGQNANIEEEYGAGKSREIIRYLPLRNNIDGFDFGDKIYDSVLELSNKLKKESLFDQSADLIDKMKGNLEDYNVPKIDHLAKVSNEITNVYMGADMQSNQHKNTNIILAQFQQQLNMTDKYKTKLQKLREII